MHAFSVELFFCLSNAVFSAIGLDIEDFLPTKISVATKMRIL